MNLNSVKKYIQSQVGINHLFVYKGSRNQDDEFSGKIYMCYSSIFTIKLDNNCIRSFSYNDSIVKNLKIMT